jgi:hypothetical protein
LPNIEVVEAWRGPGRSDGKIVVPPLAENARHERRRGGFEHWYFDARLDNGWTVIGFLQLGELITKRAGVELHVYRPDGSRLEIRKPYRRSAAWASAERCDVRVGHNWCRVEEASDDGGPQTHVVHLEEDGIRFDLRFAGVVEPWQPGGGRTTFGPRDFFAWVVPAPRAEVAGTVSIEGQEMEVKGVGYSDHNWGIGFMPRIVQRWYWGRVYAEDLTLVYANILLNEKRFGPGRWITPLMLAHGSRVVVSTGEVQMDAGPPVYEARADNSYPRHLGLVAEGVELRLDVREVMHAHSFLDDVPGLGRQRVKPLVKPVFNRLVGRPGYFRFQSDFELRAAVGSEQLERRGRTLHEMVALR